MIWPGDICCGLDDSNEQPNEQISAAPSSEADAGAVAQLGEHRLCKPGVAGSIPVRSTMIASQATEVDPAKFAPG